MLDVIARLEAWFKDVFENGAPHQKPLAQDVKVIVDHAKATLGSVGEDAARVETAVAKMVAKSELDDANTQIDNLKANVVQLVEDKNDLSQKLTAATGEIEKLKGELAAAQTDIAELTKPKVDSDTPRTTPANSQGTANDGKQ